MYKNAPVQKCVIINHHTYYLGGNTLKYPSSNVDRRERCHKNQNTTVKQEESEHQCLPCRRTRAATRIAFERSHRSSGALSATTTSNTRFPRRAVVATRPRRDSARRASSGSSAERELALGVGRASPSSAAAGEAATVRRARRRADGRTRNDGRRLSVARSCRGRRRTRRRDLGEDGERPPTPPRRRATTIRCEH